jgi:hypothetical protein
MMGIGCVKDSINPDEIPGKAVSLLAHVYSFPLYVTYT